MDAANTVLKKVMAQYQTNPALHVVHYVIPATRILISPDSYKNLLK